MFKNRKAVAMIELIFAIVVMGIAMLAIPMITSQGTKGSESAMMQESISQVAANMNAVLAKYWDNENTNPGKEEIILSTGSGNFATRLGLVNLYNQRTITGQTPASNAVTNTTAEDPDGSDDISDLNGQVVNLNLYQGQSNDVNDGDYIDKKISMATTVAFAPDNVVVAGNTLTYNFNPTANAAGSTNIKRVNVFLTTTETSSVSQNGGLDTIKQIGLNGFSCNIGGAIPDTQI